MHTLTQNRFVVPGLIAAAFHAALFLAFVPMVPVGVLAPPEAPVVLRPIPAAVIEALRPVPDPADPAAAPVRRLRGEEAASRPEPPAGATRADFPMPVPDLPAPSAPGPVSRTIPKAIGDPAGDPLGSPDLRAGTPTLLGAGELDGIPRARVQPAPVYPPELRREQISGSVTVEFAVDERGRVTSAKVLASTHRAFEGPALRAVERWQFEPGRKGGRTVAFRMAVPIQFNLTED